MTWQPIASAPKDGTEFQAWVFSGDYGYWEPKARFNPVTESFEQWGRVDYDCDGWHGTLGHPTHWMDHPAPPEGSE